MLPEVISPAPIVKIKSLTVAYRYGNAWLDAVRDVSLQIEPGQTYGLVGESGSGKTTLAMAMMRYLGENGKVREGQVEFDGRNLLSLSQNEMRQIWGASMSLVPQNPLSSLNPTIRIGEQLAEILRHHQGLHRAQAQARSLELLQSVRLPDPQRVAESYPHQISGGMQQRVLIAMALSTSPRLLVLDEPTTSLDVTTQASILDLFRDLIKSHQAAVLYVTHNLGVVAQICDRVAVLYAGELVEDAPLADLFSRPLHPYTLGLLTSVPRVGLNKNQAQLQSIPGQIPALGMRPAGCVFEPRCKFAIEICRSRPPLFTPTTQHHVRCYRWEEIDRGELSSKVDLKEEFLIQRPTITLDIKEQIPTASTIEKPSRETGRGETPTLSINHLTIHYDVRRSLAEFITRQPVAKVKAVEDVNLTIQGGKTVGLVGESGSGKTSLARAVVGLTERTGGDIGLLGLALPSKLSKRNKDTLRHLQMVFQNPEEALNPYLTVGASLRRPLIVLLGYSPSKADAEAKKLLAAVRLPIDYVERMPWQLSGGEKQRVAIARAFASHPDLLIADEPVSSLDVSVQASILNLLNQLQAEYGSALLFISHDLAVVSYLSDEIAVIYLGHLMEVARADDLFEPPYHPYTEALLSAIPLVQPEAMHTIIRLEGDVPSPMEVPTGCPFHTRCPCCLGDICVQQTPPWRIDERTGKKSFCHIPLDELSQLQKRILPAIE